MGCWCWLEPYPQLISIGISVITGSFTTSLLLAGIAFTFLPGVGFAGQEAKQARLVRKPSLSTKEVRPAFTVKPSDINVPDDVPLGQYRRSHRPFKNWTLICDENLKAKKRVCNITQSVRDELGGVVLSWSLAATEAGKPFMIMRLPLGVGSTGNVALNFNDASQPIIVSMAGCNADVCIAYLPVGPRMRSYINRRRVTNILYTLDDGKKMSFPAPLQGLSEAIQGI